MPRQPPDRFAGYTNTSSIPVLYWIDWRGDVHSAPADSRTRNVDFTQNLLTRQPISHPHKPNKEGFHVVSQIDESVWFESLTEKKSLQLIDYAYHLRSVVSQPFCAIFPGGVRHYPDFLVTLANRTSIVFDIKAGPHLKPKDRIAFDFTREMCRQIGWAYEELTEPLIATAIDTFEWLTPYQRLEYAPEASELTRIHQCLSEPANFADVLHEAATSYGSLYHLMWKRSVGFDFTQPLSSRLLLWRYDARPPQRGIALRDARTTV